MTTPEYSRAAAAAQLVADRIGGFRYRWLTEEGLQRALWKVLEPQFAARREEPLSQRDRPDFLVSVGGFTVAVEVKVQGARSAVLRQLGRYAEHDTVAALLFVSGRRTLAAGVPAVIHGKPVVSMVVESSSR